MPLFGPPDINKLKAKGDVKGLIKALRYKKDRSVVAYAAQALGEIGDARATEPLIAALTDRSLKAWPLKQVAKALGEIGDVRAIEPLIAALGQVGTTEALKKIGAPAAEPLIAALDAGDKRDSVIHALGELGDPRAVEPLLTILEEQDLLHQELRNTVEALGNIGDSRAVEPLIAALGNWEASDVAADALGKIGDARAVDPLIAALKDKRSDTRNAAARVLKAFDDDDRVAQAIKEATKPDLLFVVFRDSTPPMQVKSIFGRKTVETLFPEYLDRTLWSFRNTMVVCSGTF
jgi:HEAT repeat protein